MNELVGWVERCLRRDQKRIAIGCLNQIGCCCVQSVGSIAKWVVVLVAVVGLLLLLVSAAGHGRGESERMVLEHLLSCQSGLVLLLDELLD